MGTALLLEDRGRGASVRVGVRDVRVRDVTVVALRADSSDSSGESATRDSGARSAAKMVRYPLSVTENPAFDRDSRQNKPTVSTRQENREIEIVRPKSTIEER